MMRFSLVRFRRSKTQPDWTGHRIESQFSMDLKNLNLHVWKCRNPCNSSLHEASLKLKTYNFSSYLLIIANYTFPDLR